MHAQAANDEVLVAGGGRQAPALFANGDELAPAREVAEELLQGAAVFALESHVMDELLEARHVLRLPGNVMEDLLFGEHSND